jgi:hypothetical protein
VTNEQITNLLRRTDQQAMHGEGIDVTKVDVVRLLEERKRLLDELQSALENGGIKSRWRHRLARAIVFAEEVAP